MCRYSLYCYALDKLTALDSNYNLHNNNYSSILAFDTLDVAAVPLQAVHPCASRP